MTAAALRRPTAAVVGSGVAGLTAAYLLQRTHHVTLFEADDRLGGHAHTHDIPTPDGRVLPVDTGFIVHNERTYPNLLRLFRELDVATQPTEMSMSITCEGCGLEYAGARGLARAVRPAAPGGRPGLPPHARRGPPVPRARPPAARPRRRRTRLDVDGLTLGTFLALGGYSDYFVRHFMIPVVACVWSSGTGAALQYPAAYLFRFLDNHGMLSVTGSPQWRTVVGGSRSYVERAAKGLGAVETGAGIRTLTRHPDGVELIDDDGQRARCRRRRGRHPPRPGPAAARGPTDAERQVLGAFEYSRNETLLHTDSTVLPAARRARASWNYRMTCARRSSRCQVSYWMNRLQRHRRAGRLPGHAQRRRPHRPGLRAAPHGLRAPDLHGALGGRAAAAARAEHRPTAFAGAYHGWGFHEDGCAAGVRAAGTFGASW